jgi:peroxiredoxin Q/BCP
MLNKKVKNFSLAATGQQTISLADLKDSKVVLYFYPKDSTPGCTTEAQQFRDLHAQFVKAGAVILGVSRDSIKSHENFKSKMALPFDLLSDTEEALCTQFGVMKMKNMYGKQVRGIERSTFLIDGKGLLRQEWRSIKADGHAAEVLAAVEALS